MSNKERGLEMLMIVLIISIWLLGAVTFLLFHNPKEGECAEVEVDMQVIGFIESRGGADVNAYDVNYHDAVGKYQVTSGALKDYNEAHKTNYTRLSLLNDDVCYIIARWYLTVKIPLILHNWGMIDTLDARLICYNWGCGNYRKYMNNEKSLPSKTKRYLKDYKKLRDRKELCPRTNKTYYERGGSA